METSPINKESIEAAATQKLEAEIKKIDAILYGQDLSYNPDRALTLRTILKLRDDKIVQLEAEKAELQRRIKQLEDMHHG